MATGRRVDSPSPIRGSRRSRPKGPHPVRLEARRKPSRRCAWCVVVKREKRKLSTGGHCLTNDRTDHTGNDRAQTRPYLLTYRPEGHRLAAPPQHTLTTPRAAASSARRPPNRYLPPWVPAHSTIVERRPPYQPAHTHVPSTEWRYSYIHTHTTHFGRAAPLTRPRPQRLTRRPCRRR